MDALDCEYIYFYQNRMSYDQFSYEDDSGNRHDVSVIHYSYDEESNDDFAFIFHEAPNSVLLIDCIANFGSVQLMQDPLKRNVWLVGKTGNKDYQTIRWYHLGSQKIVLAYLAHGVQTDPVDYHVHVTNVEASNRPFQETGVLVLTKQISVDDLTRSSFSGDAVNVVVSTETISYEAQENGGMIAKRSFNQ